MKYTIMMMCLFVFAHATIAQPPATNRDDSWKTTYRATAEKVNNLVHTKLDVRFDYEKKFMYGKAWIIAKPHFYAVDSIILDAKGMDIHKVDIVKGNKHTPLTYVYNDKKFLRIKLDRLYKLPSSYMIYIEYTAKPDELKAGGSAAITSDKGLYFINPSGKDSTKPVQIWTQGETEASSAWFPTIDKPNQKTTQEIAMTVPAKYVTLSNGKLVSAKKNTDGTRTDTWKMNLPHAPYLFFMGVGDYAVIKDSYKGKEVSYYVEKEYGKVARKIFGHTPEMMKFFSATLGVEYPWNKYAQMTARDYVSGAMENTTASLFGDFVQQNARQLVDNNGAEDVIAHELIHQWFGDLVTMESWSNLALNESFATYGEVLWTEYKYGKDAGQHKNYTDMLIYQNSNSENKNLVRFHYRDKEEMFDRVSYNKGGTILHMLRNYVGDSAFFKSLNIYLNKYKFKTAEAHDLRLAFEEVTGKDLNWFFNQWFLGSGHPKFAISYGYNEAEKMATVSVRQIPDTGKIFRLPVDIDIYEGSNKTRHTVWVENRTDSFSFAAAAKPSLINFDADKNLVLEKQENKTIYEYIFQYHNAQNYIDRREAIDYAARKKDQAEGRTLLIQALHDPYYEIRERAVRILSIADLDSAAILTVERMARQDEKRTNRAAAIDLLADIKNTKYMDLFISGTKDSSYAMAGASLLALAEIDQKKAIELLPELRKDMKGRLQAAVDEVNILTKTDADFDEMTKQFDNAVGFSKLNQLRLYLIYLGNVNNTENFKSGFDKIITLRNSVSAFSPRFKESINAQIVMMRDRKIEMKNASNAAAIEEQVAYINEKLK